MRIGQPADRIGVNPKTLRYYESIGLPPPLRTNGGYRDGDGCYCRLIEYRQYATT